jgi:peptidoglycan/LPS O-acetylase OafA/YrhL
VNKNVKMNNFATDAYRKDIDGLRAISIISVILFHFGYLKNGYLGVDVFFVISGFLITKIAYDQAVLNNFSIKDFYLRRIRRIIPLVLFSTFITLIVGYLVMLPDDLENLSQSIIATNFSANNVLLFLTTGNYWAIANELKPLMHTWSLGIEEQFYMMFPIIFLALNGKKSRFILPLLVLLTIISVLFFLFESSEASKFYLLQYRFFELSIGGLGAIIFKNNFINFRYRIIFVFLIFLILVFDTKINSSINLLLIVIFSVGLLITYNSAPLSFFNFSLLENKLIVWIGKISFSLYIWHQIVLAFSKYFLLQFVNITDYIVMFIVILLFAVLSYKYIEQLFRDKKRISTFKLLLFSAFFFLITAIGSIYLIYVRGIIKDVPELEIIKANSSPDKLDRNSNLYIQYNERINKFDNNFKEIQKTPILIVGNSFARDFANILLESNFSNNIEISYVEEIKKCPDFQKRLNEAKYIFFSRLYLNEFRKQTTGYNINLNKVACVGTKKFTEKNGVFYNYNKIKSNYDQRTIIDSNTLINNVKLKNEWGNKYIDLIETVIDGKNTMPVFTNDHKFISPDGLHLTHAGAVYFSQRLNLDKFIK